MTAATNRRRHFRVKPKQLSTRVRSGEDLHIGLGIENISMGGIFVRCNNPMKPGRLVKLEVTRPAASQTLLIDGKVTSSVSMAAAAEGHRAPGMGISFDYPLPPHVEHRLQALIVSIDPSLARQPVAKREAIAPVLQEAPVLTNRLLPRSTFGPITASIPANRPVVDKPVALRPDEVADGLRRELLHRDQLIRELQAENKKLQQRVLNLVNRG